ncbi:uncharacterized protein [Aegilops tauschii subsp. strangulata]|nr:uncharacterized protein LOC123494360 [Aegilops tauschii subsp. strangulata]
MGVLVGSDSIRCAAANLILATGVQSGLSSAAHTVRSTPPGSASQGKRASPASRRVSPPPLVMTSPSRIVNGKARRALLLGRGEIGRGEKGPRGAVVTADASGVTKQAHNDNTPSSGNSREANKSPHARVRRQRASNRNLVWIRKELVEKGEFSADDCHPIGRSDRLPPPKQFSFLRDLWSRQTGRIAFAEVVKKMAGGGGRENSRGGGKYAAGRGRNELGRPTAPTTVPTVPPARPRAQNSGPPVNIFSRPPIAPLMPGPNMVPPGHMFPGYHGGGWGNHYNQMPQWPQQMQFSYQYIPPPVGPPINYQQQPARSSSGQIGGACSLCSWGNLELVSPRRSRRLRL